MTDAAKIAAKTATVTVVFDGNDWRNQLRITSPTGRTVVLHCNGRWSDMSFDLLTFVRGFNNVHVDVYRWGQRVEKIVTFGLLAEIFELSKKRQNWTAEAFADARKQA